MMFEKDISIRIAETVGRFKTEREFWLNCLSGNPAKSVFPYDRRNAQAYSQGSAGEDTRGLKETLSVEIRGTVYEHLMRLSKGNDYTIHVILLSVLMLLLEKYSGERDILVGTPIYKQEIEASFINTVLTLRYNVNPQNSFKEVLMGVKEVVVKADKHQNYPVEKLLEDLNLSAADRDFPLFDVVLLLENIHDRAYIQHIPHSMTFIFLRTGETLNITVEYRSLKYKAGTVERIMTHFIRLLESVLSKPEVKAAEIDILSEEEKRLLYSGNKETAVSYPGEGNPLLRTLHGLFEQQVEETPGNPAVIHGSHILSYKQLNSKANRLAHLLKSKGVGRGSIAAIIAERSVEMIVGLLGILKSGAAYLPVSPETPMVRKKYMLADSNVKTVLMQYHLKETNREILDRLSPGHVIFLDGPAGYGEMEGFQADDNNPGYAVQPRDAGYIIYTSGSTGRPKGVILEHRGIVNYIRWAAGTYVKNEKADFPLYTSFAFDLTVTSIYTPLVTGNAVVIYGGDHREFLIQKVMEENKVDVVKLTPAHLRLLRDMLASSTSPLNGKTTREIKIKRFIVGGEALDTQLAGDIHRLFNGNIEIYNEYGPTETVVGSMIYRFDPEKDDGDSVSIGQPIADTQIFILDEDMKPVPGGVVGEIVIGGIGVARGYLNRPELTAEKFALILNMYHKSYMTSSSKRFYKTGDLARRHPDGNIEFLGRRDHQVKIRGYRVELGEIENKIKSFNPNRRKTGVMKTGSLQLEQLTTVTRCKQCLLSTNFPGIRFDEHGICHICRRYEGYKEHVDRYFKEEVDFSRMVEQVIGGKRSKYDCLLLFSGGKDSSYVLYRLIEMGLRVLTYTFDNGYISEAAFRNIKTITAKLGVENLVIRAENMNNVFVETLRSNHNVCQGCWHALNTYAAKIAHEHGISLVISGLSRGQIFEMRLEGLFASGIFAEKEIEEKLLLFRKTFHSMDNKFSRILGVALDKEIIETIQFVDFFRYFHAPVQQIKTYLAGKGWIQPEDTGFCSSNCMINDVGIYVYFKEEGHHFYSSPLSWDIRLGVLSREKGLQEMNLQTDAAHVEKILNEIGYYDFTEIKDVVVIDQKNEAGNVTLAAYIVIEKGATLSLLQLLEYLSSQVPDYMIPSSFFLVERIPLTTGGKVDRKALLELEKIPLNLASDYVEPRDEKEKIMADVCKEIFNLDKIGINDNFFNLGATSFNMIQLSNRLQEIFKQEISVLKLFENPTIAMFLDDMDLDISTPGEAGEDEDLNSRKRGQDKFKKLRNKRR